MMKMQNLDRLLAPPAHAPSPPKQSFGAASWTAGHPPDSDVGKGKKVCCMKLVRTLLMLLVAMVLSAPFHARANYIRYSETVYSTDYLSAGVGGMRNFGYGTITLTNLTGTVRKAYLYWHGPMVMEATNPAVNAVVKMNGQTVVGSNIGMASDNCWFSQGYNYMISHAYRADVTSIVATNRNGNYLLTEFMKPFGTNAIGVNVNGASLLVFYDDGNPANNRDIVLFEGNDSNATSPFPTNSPAYDDIGWNVKLSGINYTSGPVAMQFHVSDGQYFEPLDDGPITMNNSIVLEAQGHAFSGNSVPSANNGPKNNGSLWDIRTYSVGQYLTNGINTISVSNKFVLSDCISLVAAVINLPAGAAPRTNAPPAIACQEPITLSSPNPAVIVAQVTYSGVTAPTYDISVDGIIVKSGTLPASTNSANGTLSLTNSFGYGTHTVTFTLKDVIGTAVCSTAVTLPPNINCSPNLVQPTDLSKSNAVVNFTVTSDAAGATIACSPPSGSVFQLGLTTVNCTASDTGGNSAACSFMVNVVDIEPPILHCPQNRIVSTELGANSAIVTYEIVASDNVPGVTSTCSPPSGSRFPLGPSTVNCTATDLAGNSATCSFTITIHDDEKPTFVVCPTNIVQTMDAGKSNAVVTWAIAATDNVPGVTVACTPRSGSVFPAGTTPVNCVATDLAGNSATCGFSVTIIDKEPPQITCPATLVLGTDTNTCAASNVVYTLTVIDNVNSGTTYACSPPSGSTFPKGTNLVSCTATDAAGNQASCSFQVIVKDAQPPILTLPNIVHGTDSNSCSAVVTFTPVATDICAGEVMIVCTPPSGSTFNKGATSVSCRATDASGNSVTNSFTITVEDNEPPVVSCPATIVRATDAGRTDAIVTFAPTAVDNCGTATVTTVPASGSRFLIGTNLVTVTATDLSGNRSTCTFLVVVVDQEPPRISCPAPIVRNTDTSTCAASNVTWTVDVGDNVPGGTSYTCTPAPGSTLPKGTNIVSCTARDAAGNQSSCSFMVIVNDSQPPVLKVPANIVQHTDTGTCSAVVSFTPSASDICSSQVAISCNPPSGSSFNNGTSTVVCRATDSSGNSITNSFTVTVEDKEAPVIACPQNIRVPSDFGKSTAVVDFTVSATDNCGTPTVVSDPLSGTAFPMGTNTVTSTATDASGNKSTCTFLVIVRDIEPPKITCPISELVVSNTPGLCSAPVNYAVGATDNMHMGGVVCQPPTGAVFPVGTNKVTCVATDEGGNTNACSFMVIVRDVDKPSLQLVGGASTTVECHTPFNDPGATANDNCGGNLTPSIKVTGVLDVNTPGAYTRTYTVTDASGNSASATRTIRVVDTRAPVVTLTGGSPFKVPCGKGYEEPGYTATDVCAGDLSPAVVVSGSVDASSPGTYALTYTVVDPAGNTTTVTRQVEVASGLVEGGELYPIAVSKDSLAAVAVGDVVANIYNGTGPGNFGWLTWSGSSSAGVLASSLVPPGTSKTYVNPNNPSDHVVSAGDWVRGNTGLSNSKDVRNALDNLKLMDITVPVYDVTTGSGGNTLYHVVALARFRLTNYDLPGQNKISARFLGYVTCTCEGTDLMSMSLESTPNNGAISANTVLWFNSALQVSGVKTNAVTIRLVNQTITSSDFSLSVSNASIIIDPAATTATTDFVKGEWVTRVPLAATNGNIFFSGLAYKLPANLAGNLKITWNGTFVSDTPDVTLSWKWAVANYSDLGNDPNLLGVKPVDSAVLSAYKNADLAGTPEKMKPRLLVGHGSASDYTGAYSGVAVVSACNGADGQSLVKPKALNVQTVTGGKRAISWSSKSGKSYKVQYKDNLLAPTWTNLPGTVTATGAVSAITDGSTGAAQRYYRVLMLP
jgi:hypothetical protein